MSREPLYKKAEEEMLRRITGGIWPIGERLGNEFELADEFGVSQGTMRRALITLEGMGYLLRKPGRGTIVAKPKAASNAAPVGFDRLTGMGGDPLEMEVFRSHHSLRAPSPADQALFQNGRVHEFTRTLKTGGTRFALEEVMVPDHICPDPDEDLPADFVELLSALDLPVARIDDRLHAEETSMGDSVALAVDRHTPLLCLTRVAYAADGTALAKQVLRMAGAAAYGVTSGG